MAGVRLEKAVKDYGATRVIHDVDLQIDDGEFAVFVGPSGCGKSTLLRMIAGLEDITDGSLYIGDQEMNAVPPAKRGIAMVFQSYALYPHLTTFENMAFGLRLAKRPKAEIEERVMRAAGILQIEELLQRKPKDMSGGQRQRVAIGRAIVRNPEVFLFDEPLSNLDAKLRVQMRQELAELHAQLKTTMIYVTHDQVEAMTMADKIVVLRAGHVEQVGAPLDLYHRPANKFVAGFIGSPAMNFVSGVVAEGGDSKAKVKLDNTSEDIIVPLARPVQSGEKISLGLRPEHTALVENSPLKGTVAVVERLGSVSFAYVKVGDAMLTVQAEGSQVITPGSQVGIELPADRLHMFGADEVSVTAGTA
ncbi:sn-glycerol-3-phosphate ABC transporter ATP-binding protein UgpC [Alphaproteobacteria bacterium]|nr:sn-glycerol-3-phosphate ABC transporter ATP-binding protein UgpC [Alphaproteobacteria bacterium]